jgi:hypothetical protein
MRKLLEWGRMTRKLPVQCGETRKPCLVPQKSWWVTPNDAEP